MKKILLSFLSLIPLAACSIDTDIDTQTASQIARPAFMVERTINGSGFGLAAWERMHERYQPATVYIEDDGVNAVKSDDNISISILPNPTPENPVALHLASRDLSDNVAYIARPCQYVKNPEDKGCNSTWWKENRYSSEVMLAYEMALDDIAARYNITGFNLVGYGGGANIAAVLAATRDDVLTLRTVAGNLSPTYVIDYHDAMTLSEDAVLATDYGSELAKVPQHHFLGAADDVIPPGTYHSYRQAVGLSDCINYSVIQDANHELGWVQIWPQLLGLTPACAILFDDLPPLPPAGEFPGDYYKGLGKGSGLVK